MSRTLVVSELIPNAPETWERTTLGEICRRGGGSIQTGPFGSQLHASDYVPVGIPTIMPVNIGHNRIVPEGIARIREADASRLSKHRVQPGDIIYSRRGDVERHALIRDSENGWLCGTGCLKIRFGNGVINPQYATFFLGHPEIRAWIVRHAVGATMPNLNTSIMESVPFLLPSPKEQDRIANILGTLDDKIELNRLMNETLEAMARRLFRSWFMDFDPVHAKAAARREFPDLDNAELSRRALPNMAPEIAELFPDTFQESPIGPIPKGWGAGTVVDICSQTGNGGTPRRDTPEYWEPASVPWLTSGEVRQSIITKTDSAISETGLKHSAAKWWPAWTTIVALYGATAGQSTLSAIELTANQACCGLQPNRGFRFYLYLFVSSATERLNQLARGSAQQNLSKQIVEELSLIIPESRIAALFDSILEPVISDWIVNLKESQRLEDTRDNLIPRLLSGALAPAKES